MSRTVKVRIAVAVGPSGAWSSAGWSTGSDRDRMDIAIEGVEEEGEARYWLEAELIVPDPDRDALTVTASVTPESESNA